MVIRFIDDKLDDHVLRVDDVADDILRIFFFTDGDFAELSASRGMCGF